VEFDDHGRLELKRMLAAASLDVVERESALGKRAVAGQNGPSCGSAIEQRPSSL
jgi:hypothetical protein